MLEIKDIVTKENFLDGFISRLGMVKKRIFVWEDLLREHSKKPKKAKRIKTKTNRPRNKISKDYGVTTKNVTMRSGNTRRRRK